MSNLKDNKTNILYLKNSDVLYLLYAVERGLEWGSRNPVLRDSLVGIKRDLEEMAKRGEKV